MIFPRSGSRLSSIALTTPPLRHILIRALHPSPPSAAGGARPKNFGLSRSSDRDRTSGSFSRNERNDGDRRAGFGRSDRPEGGDRRRSDYNLNSGSGEGRRSSFGSSPSDHGARPISSYGGGERRPDFGSRNAPRSDSSSRFGGQSRPPRYGGGAGLAHIDKGRPAPSSSRRLANFDPSPSSSYSRPPRSRYPNSTERDDTSGGSQPHHRPTEPRYPKSQPFEPPTYATTPTLADPAQARPRTFDTFTSLQGGLIESLKARFGEDGVTTPIQTLSYERLSSLPSTSTTSGSGGTRVLLGAETGSGKTFAYLVPLFHHLKATDHHSDQSDTLVDALYPRSIILSPTHELTRQSTRFAKSLTHNTKLSVVGLSDTSAGGVGDRRGLTDVLMGTVGSVRRMLGIKRPGQEEEMEDKEDVGAGLWKPEEKKGIVRRDKVEWMVIDEADVLLGGDFSEETLAVLTKLSPRNLILCTATLPPSLLNLLNSHPFFTSSTSSAPSENLDSSSSEVSETEAAPGFIHLLSPGLHKLPPKLETRFVPPSRTKNRFADVAHEIRRAFSEDAIKRKSQLKAAAAAAAVDSADPSATPSASASAGAVEEKSKIVIFVNSDKKVEKLASILELKGLECLAWTGDGEERVRGRNGALDEFLLPADVKRREVIKPTISPATWTESEVKSENDESTYEAPSSTKPKPTTAAGSSNKDRRRILVTTSLLSRGLDFHPSVSSIFLLDPPRDVLDFVHRAGRAGRAGREGRVVVFGLGDGSGVGQSGSRPRKNGSAGGGGGLEKGLGDVIGKRDVRRSMAGGRIKKPRV
ncbi:hypothetical protein CI109_106276 [Kwoniella shandongensis]|uniref:RNA helicase n=1 Tax=Kwoniella shandongensis TaxID=1734106 RepID=A0A5M6BSG4_9TREE|nr:uncharacterized protein CI109_006720 [Kwoniella shandongensis]KAA5524920.1 hypothetical protein CI109_006720 [Kwoniella shandongensis]